MNAKDRNREFTDIDREHTADEHTAERASQARIDAQPASTAAAQPSGARKRWLTIVVGAFLAIGIAYGAWWALVLRFDQSTDDAYVAGNVVQITSQVAGTVVKIAADDT